MKPTLEKSPSTSVTGDTTHSTGWDTVSTALRSFSTPLQLSVRFPNPCGALKDDVLQSHGATLLETSTELELSISQMNSPALMENQHTRILDTSTDQGTFFFVFDHSETLSLAMLEPLTRPEPQDFPEQKKASSFPKSISTTFVKCAIARVIR